MGFSVQEAKEEVLKTAQLIYEEGLVFETWGNVSAKAVDNEIVITPSGIPYSQMQLSDIVVVSSRGNTLEGRRKPSTELPLHLAIYNAREEIKGIVHTHSIYSTAFAVSRMEIPVVLEEQAQVIGSPVKVSRYALPGSTELAQYTVETLGKEGTAVLLANHGLVTTGENLKLALQKCRVIERNALIFLWSSTLGTPAVLGEEEVKKLRNSFLHKYGQKE